MSCQPSHWARRNVSPASSKQGPVRATVPVSLMRQSPGSPTKTANKKESASKSPSSKDSIDGSKPKTKKFADENKANFLGSREKSKTLNLRTQPQEHYIRRTASLDALYIASQWQPDAIFLGYCGHLMIDKATQTPEEWNEGEKRKNQRKPIVTTGDQFEVKYIRQKLQRTNQNRVSGVLLSSQRQSPIHGDHSAILVTTNNSNYSSYHSASTTISSLHNSSHASAPGNVHSGPIPIAQGPKPNIPRLQNSVEGLNLEIEKLVLRELPGPDRDGDYGRFLEPTPEGHRAPIAELFHSSTSEDIQSLVAGRDSYPSSGNASRSHSISPAIPIIPGNPEFSISPHSDDTESVHKFGTSPHINQFLARGPPDGCEKVKIVEEPRNRSLSELSPNSSSLKPRVTYVLLPSQSSAFCPLYKELKPPKPSFETFTLVSSTQTTDCHQ